MRIRTSIHLLGALTLLSTVAACGGGRRARPDREQVVAVEWDSAPLDRDYNQRRTEMEARHRDEIAHARADETADRRDARQAAERQDLEDRYRRGKDGHMKNLPPSNHDHDGDHH